jgi:hypothetical protein
LLTLATTVTTLEVCGPNHVFSTGVRVRVRIVVKVRDRLYTSFSLGPSHGFFQLLKSGQVQRVLRSLLSDSQYLCTQL